MRTHTTLARHYARPQIILYYIPTAILIFFFQISMGMYKTYPYKKSNAKKRQGNFKVKKMSFGNN